MTGPCPGEKKPVCAELVVAAFVAACLAGMEAVCWDKTSVVAEIGALGAEPSYREMRGGPEGDLSQCFA